MSEIDDHYVEEPVPPEPTTKLFVYGLLKRGFALAYYMRGSKFLGVATVPFALFEMATGRPAGRLSEKPGLTRGELYDVPNSRLPALDYLEGHPDNFVRKPVKVSMEDMPDNDMHRPSPLVIDAQVYFGANNHPAWPVFEGEGEFLG